MMSPELTAQLAEVVAAGIAEAIAGRQAEMQERYDKLISDYQAGYRDGEIWRRAQLDRDRHWLEAIRRFQSQENRSGPRWRLLQELACAMVPPRRLPPTPQEPTNG